MTAPTPPPLVRPATTADLDAVRAIYDHEVRSGHATFDLTTPPVSTWQAKLDDPAPGIHLLVATLPDRGGRDGGDVVGYAYSAAYRPRAAYDRTREVSVYLAPSAQGRGVGRALYAELLARLDADGVHTVLAMIASPNPASEALHRACGFAPAGVLPEVGFKHDRWLDVAVWARRGVSSG